MAETVSNHHEEICRDSLEPELSEKTATDRCATISEHDKTIYRNIDDGRLNTEVKENAQRRTIETESNQELSSNEEENDKMSYLELLSIETNKSIKFQNEVSNNNIFCNPMNKTVLRSQIEESILEGTVSNDKNTYQNIGKDSIRNPSSATRRKYKLESIANKLMMSEMYHRPSQKRRLSCRIETASRNRTITDAAGDTIVLVMSESEDDSVALLPESSTEECIKDTRKKRKKKTPEKLNKEGYPCSKCDEVFLEKMDLSMHKSVHAAEKRHVCVSCGKSFFKLTQLVRHRMVHEPSKSKFVCDLCSKKFANQINLDMHLRVHAGERPYACPKCNMTFTQQGHLIGHMKTHMAVKPHPCSDCGKRFARRSDLKNHVRTHTGEKPYLCTICGREFTQRAHLDNHFKTHSGEKPHKCEECGKHFTRKTDVTRHMRIHTGVRPFVCEICGKGFAQSSQYNTHSRVHTGAKPYSCPKCQRRFAQSANRKKHIKVCKKDIPISLIIDREFSEAKKVGDGFQESEQAEDGHHDVVSFQEMLTIDFGGLKNNLTDVSPELLEPTESMK